MPTALERRADSDRLQEWSCAADYCALQMQSCSHFYLPAQSMGAQRQTKAGYSKAKENVGGVCKLKDSGRIVFWHVSQEYDEMSP